ncbi:hypothetical protein [Endozoicomonas sp.]|uniref:hypothetical protein n=1 Tax=Endozoicomonas sp. TaxID=1892382 RepID=UPI00383B93BE
MSRNRISDNTLDQSNKFQDPQLEPVDQKGVSSGRTVKPMDLHASEVDGRSDRPYGEVTDDEKKVIDRTTTPKNVSKEARGKIERFFMGTLEVEPSKSRASIISSLSESDIEGNLPEIEDMSDIEETAGSDLDGEFKQYHEALDKFKVSLGGSPNYSGKRPKLRTGKKIFGLSIDTVRFWVSKALQKKWFPEPLFRTLGRRIGLGGAGLTRYEYLALSLQSIRKIKKNLPEIQARLISNKNACSFFNKKTGLTFHERLNDPKTLSRSLSDYVDLAERHVDDAIKNDYLQEFFDVAMPSVDVCFEARMSSLLAYSVNHPLDDTDAMSLDNIADYNSDSSLEHVLNEEIKVLVIGWVDLDIIDSDHIYDYLVNNRGLLGKSFQGGYCDTPEFALVLGEEIEKKKVVITDTFLRKYLDYAENTLCLF